MKQEDKELLIKDLCARLPYGVKCLYKNKNVFSIISIDLEKYSYIFITNNDGFRIGEPEIKNIKPYLFPLSSMTEEQEKEWKSRMSNFGVRYDTPESYDYLYENHIDVRGLIPKGLANDATGLNIY